MNGIKIGTIDGSVKKRFKRTNFSAVILGLAVECRVILAALGHTINFKYLPLCWMKSSTATAHCRRKKQKPSARRKTMVNRCRRRSPRRFVNNQTVRWFNRDASINSLLQLLESAAHDGGRFLRTSIPSNGLPCRAPAFLAQAAMRATPSASEIFFMRSPKCFRTFSCAE